MNTELLKVDPRVPDPEVLEKAGDALRAGKLVAFPTETVYGLGADALNPAAVARIFEAKGRPATNPLIVHLADVSQVSRVAAAWPEIAVTLAARYWPGPLTLIVPKTDAVPDSVTAGGKTVGLRIPAHPVARGVIAAADVPVAAPSANRFTEISPTTAEHVLKGLSGRIDLILDGGPTQVGIESTVLDVSGPRPVLWRAGMISQTELEALIGPIVRISKVEQGGRPLASPGQHFRHYAPKADVRLIGFGDRAALAATVARLSDFQPASNSNNPHVGCLVFQAPDGPPSGAVVKIMPNDPKRYAGELYATLHDMENAGIVHLIIEDAPPDDRWTGIRDRLHRAAAREAENGE